MSNANSGLTRVPTEIWRKILLEVMDVPYMLDTICVGSFFEFWRVIHSNAHWSRSESQRKLLRHVCKSWKHFADTKAYRSISFRDDHQPPHVLAHARQVHLCYDLRHMLATPTLWEVVDITTTADLMMDRFLASLRQGYHPRLRRLTVSMGLRQNPFFLSVISESAIFRQLTFLHVIFPLDSYWRSMTPPGQATLPCLEVLIWEDCIGVATPCSIFRLPGLHHFGWRHPTCFPLSTLLSYAPTLHSLSIRRGRWSQNPVTLPDLNEFPLLNEFSIDAAFELKDPNPVPPIHPLHSVYLQDLDSITIHGVMQLINCNPVNLRRIRSALQWGKGGELECGTPEKYHEHDDNPEEIIRLVNMCQELGIRVEDSKGRVRSDMLPAVELRDFTF
jgi:hypothetical protein